MQSRYWIVLITSAVFNLAQAAPASFCAAGFHSKTKQQLRQIYSKAPNHAHTTMTDRITYYSDLFLNKPYILTSLGEGPNGEFDQAPLYRFDGFDCQTYVETVLALAQSDTPQHFQFCLRHIRYQEGHIDYIQRHHFTAPDWNNDNQKLGFLEDVTLRILDKNHHRVARYAKTTIEPAAWYQHFTTSQIRLCTTGSPQKQLQQLQKRTQHLANTTFSQPYIPTETLLNDDSLLPQIPNISVIEIVRPNWDLTRAIGTHLNVSHLGIAIREHGVLYFYQASTIGKKVQKAPLIDYLKHIQDSPTIRGIHIQRILPSTFCQKALPYHHRS
ncbi:MAG: DUF1460 domain-containing protein [Gammaproteobacteria bacterium]|nr:DUF1460 domain-containing protein [Gammaproteobacteria bacterium]